VRDEADREIFVRTPGEASERSAFRVHGFVLIMNLDWIRAVEYWNAQGPCRACHRMPETPGHRSLFAAGGRNNIEESNIKWLTPLIAPTPLDRSPQARLLPRLSSFFGFWGHSLLRASPNGAEPANPTEVTSWLGWRSEWRKG
jgi:hypothetical protein